MERLALALGLAIVAVAVAALVQRRQRPAAPARTGYDVPDQLDRGDFDRPEAPWLVAVFSSATCSTCAGVWEKVRQLESEEVAVQDVELVAQRDLHRRYRIEAVPITVVADDAGVVRASFLGAVRAGDLWAAVAALREEPGGSA
jgi:hypothetical protein